MTPKNKIVVFDLDDTLYKEVDFMKSAFMEIAQGIEADDTADIIAKKMLKWWKDGNNVFQHLIKTYHLNLTIDSLLSKYRSHFPSLLLDEVTKNLLQMLSEKAVLGLITDGRSNTQHNKIAALGLNAFMNQEDILVSGDRDKENGLNVLKGNNSWEKPSELPFKYFMSRYSINYNPSIVNYYYIGDNPSKDFSAPNHLGWATICLLDDGRNIHHQDFSLPQHMLPQYTISRITEIENIII